MYVYDRNIVSNQNVKEIDEYEKTSNDVGCWWNYHCFSYGAWF